MVPGMHNHTSSILLLSPTRLLVLVGGCSDAIMESTSIDSVDHCPQVLTSLEDPYGGSSSAKVTGELCPEWGFRH